MGESDNIAVNVVNLLLPAIGVLTTRVLDDGFTQLSGVVNRVKAGVRRNSYDIDRLEQYTRRENLRITGLQEENEEDLNSKLIDIFKAVDVEIENGEFRCHRVGEKRGKPRQVIARFFSRDKRNAILQNRSKLKDRPNYRGVYLSEDLTTLRFKLLNVAKKKDDVKSVTSRNGKNYLFYDE